MNTKLHVVVKPSVLSDDETKEIALQRILEASGTDQFNPQRWKRYGLLSLNSTLSAEDLDELIGRLEQLDVVSSVNRDKQQEALRSND